MTRTIEHGKRTGYASLAAGGLNRDSFPMRLFLKGNAKHWNPADIDFRQDIEDFAAMTEDERRYTTRLAAQFLAGEESVTQDLQPFVAAMAAVAPCVLERAASKASPIATIEAMLSFFD